MITMSEIENKVVGLCLDKSAKIFDKFIDAVRNRIRQADKQISIPVFLRKKYNKAEVKYTASKDFRNMILEHLFDIRKRKGDIYTHIHEVVGMLNAAKQKNGDNKSISEQKNDQLSENTEEGTSTDDTKKKKSQRKKEKKQKRRIKRLELHLKELSKEIKRLGEKELTLDDMDDDESDHIMEHKLKLRFNRVWEKLCELKDVPTSTGRVTEQYLIFEGTRFTEINQKLEKLMNKSEFPNFKNVLEVVRKVNNNKELHLTEREVSDIAEKSFKVIGNRLQQRREVDLAYNFGSHLTENFKFVNDPAKTDAELNRKLRENHKIGEDKLDKWIRTCCEKQEETGEDKPIDEGPPEKRHKLDSSDEESEKEYEEEDDEEGFLQEIVSDDELEKSENEEEDLETSSSTCDDDELAPSTTSSQNTDDDQFLPEHSKFSHHESVEDDKGFKTTNLLMVNAGNSSVQYNVTDTQVVSPSSSTDHRWMLDGDSPQEVTSSTSPKHLSEVMDWPNVETKKTNFPEIIVLSSSDESPDNSPVAKRINHMTGYVKNIPLPISSDEEDSDCIVISD